MHVGFSEKILKKRSFRFDDHRDAGPWQRPRSLPVTMLENVYIYLPYDVHVGMDGALWRNHGVLYVVIGLGIIAAAVFWSFLDTIAVAATLAVVVIPLRRRLERTFSRHAAGILATAIVTLMFGGVIVFLIEVLYANLGYMAEVARAILAVLDVSPFDAANLPPYISPATLERIVDQQLGALGAGIGGILFGLPSVLLEVMVFFLSFYLFVAEGDRVYLELVRELPSDLRGLAEQLSRRATDTLYAIYVVEVAIAVITFFIALPFFVLLGYGHVLFLAAIAGLFQLVPILGQWFIMLILGIYALAIGDLRGAAILAFVGYPLVSAFPDVVLRPVLSGRQAGVHPVVMWIGIFGGLEVLGVVGFVLGPLVLTLFIAGYRHLIELSGTARSEGGEPRNGLPPGV